MAHTTLTISELQAIIYSLEMQHRRHVWNIETRQAEICQDKIDGYREQLKTLQDEKAKA